MSQLNTLIGHLLGELTKGDRQKIMTICTIDVHARDVVAKLISQKIDNSQAFIWLSQLRHRYISVCVYACTVGFVLTKCISVCGNMLNVPFCALNGRSLPNVLLKRHIFIMFTAEHS